MVATPSFRSCSPLILVYSLLRVPIVKDDYEPR